MQGKENKKEKKKWKKKRFEVNKLFLNITLNLFHLFSYIILRLNNFKMYKFLIDFNYLWFDFIFFIIKSNMIKSFSLILFFS